MGNARNLLLATLLIVSGLAAQNVNAPDAPKGGAGTDVLAASNAGGSSNMVFNFTPEADSDQSYTVVIKNSAGDVVDTHFVESGACPPMTIPAGGRAYIHDVDPSEPDDSKSVTGTATMT